METDRTSNALAETHTAASPTPPMLSVKDFGATGIEIPAVPDVVPDMDSVLRALDENYGYHV